MPTIELTDKELDDAITFLERGMTKTAELAKKFHVTLAGNVQFNDLVNLVAKFKRIKG